MKSTVTIKSWTSFPLPDVVRIKLAGVANRRSTKTIALSRHCRDVPNLRQDFFDHLPMDVGETEIASAVTISQSLVIKPHQMEQRGM